MKTIFRIRFVRSFVLLLCTHSVVSFAQETANSLPSETPAKFKPVTSSFDYIKRDVMIPMRDGVKLHTVILVPKGAKNAPILLTRTPYNATSLTQPRGRVRISGRF